MSDTICRNICRDTATSAVWNVTYRPWLTIFAPISATFSRSVVSDQCSMSCGKANDRFGSFADSTVTVSIRSLLGLKRIKSARKRTLAWNVG